MTSGEGVFYIELMVIFWKKENLMRLFPEDEKYKLRDLEEEDTNVLITEDPYPDIEIIPYRRQRFLQWNDLDD